jgi:hypothetical protein
LRPLLVDPPVAAVLVDRSERLLHEARDACRERGVDERGGRLAPDAVVLSPLPWQHHVERRAGHVRGKVDHRIVARHGASRGVAVEEVERDRGGAECGQARSALRRAADGSEAVARGDQRGERDLADDPRRSGEEDARVGHVNGDGSQPPL